MCFAPYPTEFVYTSATELSRKKNKTKNQKQNNFHLLMIASTRGILKVFLYHIFSHNFLFTLQNSAEGEIKFVADSTGNVFRKFKGYEVKKSYEV